MDKIIINADDFGHSAEVTNAIIKAFEEGVIDRASIMVNMPDFSRAAALADQYGLKHSIGLHLNLTEGYPLSEGIKKDPLFCDIATGQFNRRFRKSFISRIRLPKSTEAVVIEEIRAQIQKYKEFGFLDHVDSHHHVHKDYAILKLLLPLLKQYSLTSLRIARNTASGFARLYNDQVNRVIAMDPYVRPASDVLFDSLCGASGKANGIIEIEVHPVLKDGKLFDHGVELSKVKTLRNGAL